MLVVSAAVGLLTSLILILTGFGLWAISLGLLAQISVQTGGRQYRVGDVVPVRENLPVTVSVFGPSWVDVDRVELYANGRKIREQKITHDSKDSVKWSGEWTLPHFRHDVYLVAIASGPGVTEPYWPIAKPYQPTSPVAEPRVIGSTGAVWLDGDGDSNEAAPR